MYSKPRISYNLAIKDCALYGDVRGAQKVLRQIELLGLGSLGMVGLRQDQLSPDVISYTTVLRACTRSVQWALALSVLNSMSADTIAVNVAMSAASAASQWQAVLALFYKLPDPQLKPDVASFGLAAGPSLGQVTS